MPIPGAPVANDNAYTTGQPVVRTAGGRSEATYARSDNVILPLRFARRMTGWQLSAGKRSARVSEEGGGAA